MTTAEIKALVLREAKSAAHARIILPLYKTAIETLLARQAEVPAAGPWRYDVENAPKAESCIVAFVIFCGTGDLVSISVAHLGDDGIWCHSNGGRRINRIIAFATINPPEIEG